MGGGGVRGNTGETELITQPTYSIIMALELMCVHACMCACACACVCVCVCVKYVVSWCFEPSQPQRTTSGQTKANNGNKASKQQIRKKQTQSYSMLTVVHIISWIMKHQQTIKHSDQNAKKRRQQYQSTQQKMDDTSQIVTGRTQQPEQQVKTLLTASV